MSGAHELMRKSHCEVRWIRRYPRTMATFPQELRQAWRSLLQRKAYFLTCAGTLTLVLGANAAMFAVVNATLLRPMPFATGGPVVHLFVQPPGTTAALQRNPLQQMEVPRLREQARTLARLEGFYPSERVVTLNGEPGVAQTAAVTPGFFTMMAAPIAQGRAFLPSEGEPGHPWRSSRIATGAIPSGRAAFWAHRSSSTASPTPSSASSRRRSRCRSSTPRCSPRWYASAEPQPRSPPRSVVALAELAPGDRSRRPATS